MDQRWLVSRRALLGGLGATAALALAPRRFQRVTQAQAVPPRLIVVHVPEGMWNGAPRPMSGSTNLGTIFEALQPFQSRMLVMNNLNMQSRDHGPGGDGHHRGVPHMFTGTEMLDESNAGGPSIDQKIAQAIGGDSTYASLQFAVRIVYGDTNSRCLWSAPGRVVPAMQNPWDAYNRIFGNFTPPDAPRPMVNLRRSALDHALGDIATLRTRLTDADRTRLDSYQDSLREIERRLDSMQEQMPSACTLPMLGGRTDAAAESNYPAIGALQMDLMVAALQCGITRVASMQWGNSNDQCAYSWLGVNTLGHDMAHNNNNCDPSGSKKLTVYRWYAEQAAYLLRKLDSIQEGDGTMLDNTVVLWASEFGDSNGHSSNNLTWLLMGNAGNYFKPGRILNCGGRSTNDVHASLCQAFGLPDTNFGNAAYCDGPLTDLT